MNISTSALYQYLELLSNILLEANGSLIALFSHVRKFEYTPRNTQSGYNLLFGVGSPARSRSIQAAHVRAVHTSGSFAKKREGDGREGEAETR